jgi:hypothetical protein
MGYTVDIVLALMLGWTVYSGSRAVRGLQATVARHERMLTQAAIKLGENKKEFEEAWSVLRKLENLAPVNLAAEITSLSEQVARLRHTHQRFQGRFDKYVALERERDDEPDEPDDERWQALMSLQRQTPNGGG